MSYRAQTANCTPEPATAVRAWYSVPGSGECAEVEVVRYSTGAPPTIYYLGTNKRVPVQSSTYLSYDNPCCPSPGWIGAQTLTGQGAQPLTVPEGTGVAVIKNEGPRVEISYDLTNWSSIDQGQSAAVAVSLDLIRVRPTTPAAPRVVINYFGVNP